MKSEVLIYQAKDGSTRIDVRMEEESVWLTLDQISELFQRDRTVIFKHIKNIVGEGELEADSTIAKSAIVQQEGGRRVKRNIESYNLDVIISVGYRVNSPGGSGPNRTNAAAA